MLGALGGSSIFDQLRGIADNVEGTPESRLPGGGGGGGLGGGMGGMFDRIREMTEHMEEGTPESRANPGGGGGGGGGGGMMDGVAEMIRKATEQTQGGGGGNGGVGA